MNDKVAEFARLLVENVRDKAIQSCDGLVASLNNETKSVISKRWSDVRSREGETAFLQAVVADCVDDTIFQLLNAIDEGMLPVTFERTTLPEDGEGEMAGLYMCSGGWREVYTNERYVDDYKNL